MNSCLVLALLLVTLGLAQAKIDWEEAEKNFNECKEEVGAEETFEETVKKDNIPTSEKGMCLVDCVLRTKGIYDKESKYDSEGANKYFSKIFGPDTEKIEKVTGAVEECSKIDVEGLNKCEAAVKHLTCVKAKCRELKLKPE